MSDAAQNPKGYHVFKNFLTKEEAVLMAEHIDKHAEPDPKPNFRWFQMPGTEDDFLAERFPMEYDPNGKIRELVEFSRKFIEENFNLWGTLALRRVHGNIMDEGSHFPYHEDEDPNQDGSYDGAKRTYVADLFLNDDYEGGDFGFDVGDSEVREYIKPETGDLIIFNGYNTRHGIEEITGGRRINIMGIFFDLHPNYNMDDFYS